MNARFGLIAAAAAFAVSLLLGLVSGTPGLVIMARAVLFAALFFGLAAGIAYLARSKLDFDGGGLATGQNVDFSVGGPLSGKKGAFGAELLTPEDAFETKPAARKTGDFNPDADDGALGDISDLYAPFDDGAGSAFGAPLDTERGNADGGLAQNADYHYHNIGSIADGAETAPDFAPPPDSSGPGGLVSDFESFVPGIPGVDGAESAYVSSGGRENGGFSGGERGMPADTVEMSLRKPNSEPDFSNLDGKKAAGAIQTILKKDKD